MPPLRRRMPEVKGVGHTLGTIGEMLGFRKKPKKE